MQLSICFKMCPSMEVVDISLNKMLLGQYFDSCLGKYTCVHLSIVIPILGVHALTKRFLAVLYFVHSVEL